MMSQLYRIPKQERIFYSITYNKSFERLHLSTFNVLTVNHNNNRISRKKSRESDINDLRAHSLVEQIVPNVSNAMADGGQIKQSICYLKSAISHFDIIFHLYFILFSI